MSVPGQLDFELCFTPQDSYRAIGDGRNDGAGRSVHGATEGTSAKALRTVVSQPKVERLTSTVGCPSLARALAARGRQSGGSAAAQAGRDASRSTALQSCIRRQWLTPAPRSGREERVPSSPVRLVHRLHRCSSRRERSGPRSPREPALTTWFRSTFHAPIHPRVRRDGRQRVGRKRAWARSHPPGHVENRSRLYSLHFSAASRPDGPLVSGIQDAQNAARTARTACLCHLCVTVGSARAAWSPELCHLEHRLQSHP